MGVALQPVLKKHEKPLSDLAGKTLAVDAFNTLYQFITIIRQPDGTPLMDSKGRVTSHLSGLFYRTCSLLEKGIRPVFVFDGKPNPLKYATIAARAQVKHEAEEQRREALEVGEVEEAAILAQRTARLTSENIEDSKRLLEAMGLPWVQAPSEGEAQCSVMAADGVVYAAASQDFDSLLFGASLLVRNITIAGRRKLPRRNAYVDVVPEEYSLQENLTKLGITREKLVWMGMLCGTDFDPGIRGIGPKKSLKLVLEHDSFDSILSVLNQEMDWKPVFELFNNPPRVSVPKSEMQFREPDRSALLQFMCDEHDFSRERVGSALAKAFKEPASSEQSQLKKWF
ncbi:TPA: flap endonuclease-1 [Candidatus Micrarchaeota archaeon]|nr:MAG: flap endonuclease-1 [Candidatus Micrarchaeota archaeon CG1_02_51_15]HII39482.1 flap endonuclease-1 [Candidatus Micrarchaeota archaeon]